MIFQIESGQLELTISDQQPSDQEYPPTSIARIPLPPVVLQRAGDSLTLRISSGGQSASLIANVPDILFDFGKADLRPAGKDILAKLANTLERLLRSQPKVSLQIDGHTDSIGSERFNQELSERRASTVAKCLQENNVAPGRMQLRAFGELRPIASNATAEGRQRNRRVEILVSSESSGDGRFFYHATKSAPQRWTEEVSLTGIDLAFNPVETPTLLRNAWGLPAPHWIKPSEKHKPAHPEIAPPLLFGYFPLEDGLAMLPIPNLTEQIYLTLDLLHRSLPEGAPFTAPPLISGAAVFGNSSVLDAFTNEQPWSVTLLMRSQ